MTAVTIAFPDVSNHNGAMPLQAATVACLAKATEGTGYRDPYYAHFKAEAKRVGAAFGAYHFLREGNAAAQARFAYGVIGPGVPTMIDFEPEYDQDGKPISQPSLADAVGFRDTYRRLGGLVRLVYLPRWYWSGHLRSPSLAPLAGLGLVSSQYTGYSTSGPGWAPYGGLTPAVWQWTDKQPYSGHAVDFNAYRGTIDQFRALLGLDTPHTTGADMATALTTDDIPAIASAAADQVLNRLLGEQDAQGDPLAAKYSLGELVARFETVVAQLQGRDGAEIGTALATNSTFTQTLVAAVIAALPSFTLNPVTGVHPAAK